MDDKMAFMLYPAMLIVWDIVPLSLMMLQHHRSLAAQKEVERRRETQNRNEYEITRADTSNNSSVATSEQSITNTDYD